MNKTLGDDQYFVSLVLKKGHRMKNDSLGSVSYMNLRRGKSFFDLKIVYKDSESYALRYSFPKKSYQKSYVFLAGDKKIEKKKILVDEKKEVLELSSFVQNYFEDILDSDYSLGGESTISLIKLKKDLKGLIKLIF